MGRAPFRQCGDCGGLPTNLGSAQRSSAAVARVQALDDGEAHRSAALDYPPAHGRLGRSQSIDLDPRGQTARSTRIPISLRIVTKSMGLVRSASTPFWRFDPNQSVHRASPRPITLGSDGLITTSPFEGT
jgi:hypothetical protein